MQKKKRGNVFRSFLFIMVFVFSYTFCSFVLNPQIFTIIFFYRKLTHATYAHLQFLNLLCVNIPTVHSKLSFMVFTFITFFCCMLFLFVSPVLLCIKSDFCVQLFVLYERGVFIIKTPKKNKKIIKIKDSQHLIHS